MAALSAAVAGPLAIGPAVASPAGAPRPRIAASPVGHVFVITLENEGFASTFGNPAADPYLATVLPSEGRLLTQYGGIGHESNDNYLAMISGQAPNPQTQADCQIYSDFLGTGPLVAPGQALGTGCVFPSSVPTVGNQLSAKALSWKGYMQDMGNVASRESAVCGHPGLNTQDGTQSAVAGDGYVARHDPFVYFHSIVDSPAYCNTHVVPLGATTGALPAGVPQGTTGLATDLASVATTPRLSFIVPNVCSDGHDFPCTNQPSGSSALADIDSFLSSWVPVITNSPAFKADGLLVINFDEAASSDTTACCGEAAGPNSPLPGITGPGGGRTGAVLLSPFITSGSVTTTPFNHYSLLASIEDIFGLPRLGMAATVTSNFDGIIS